MRSYTNGFCFNNILYKPKCLRRKLPGFTKKLASFAGLSYLPLDSSKRREGEHGLQIFLMQRARELRAQSIVLHYAELPRRSGV